MALLLFATRGHNRCRGARRGEPLFFDSVVDTTTATTSAAQASRESFRSHSPLPK